MCESQAKKAHKVRLCYLSKMCFYTKFSTWHIHISIHTHIHTQAHTNLHINVHTNVVTRSLRFMSLFPREKCTRPLVLLHHLQKKKKIKVKRGTMHKNIFVVFLYIIFFCFVFLLFFFQIKRVTNSKEGSKDVRNQPKSRATTPKTCCEFKF